MSQTQLGSGGGIAQNEATWGGRLVWLGCFLFAILLLLLPKLPYPQFFAYPFAPHLGMILVFLWGLDETAPPGGVSVFLLGLTESLLTGSPPGLWAFCLSVLYLATMLLRRFILSNPTQALQIFAALIFGLMLVLWWLSGLVEGYYAPVFGILLSWASTCIMFPVLVRVMAWLQKYVYLGAGAVRIL